MKLILYMAMTANGMIATEDGDSSWTSAADEAKLAELRKKIGNVIMGRGTYESLLEAKEFPMPGCLNMVMTRNAPDMEQLKDVVFTDQSPEDVLEDLKKRGFDEALLIGGGELNGSFMTDGLVDEIYITISPRAFGRGIHLFGFGEFSRELDLLGLEKISENEVQLHYAVRRQTLENYMKG